MTTAPGARHRPGFAILLVLWVLVLMALIAQRMSFVGRSEIRIAQNLKNAALAEAAADGAVHTAIWHLMHKDAGWDADRRLHSVVVAGIPVTLGIEDEAGKVNPNDAPPALLRALFVASGVAPGRAEALAAAIALWRNPKPDPAVRAGGAAAYRQAGLPYGPAFAPFGDLDDLAAVLGMNAETFQAVAPHLSLAARGLPDLKRADPVVAEALAHAGLPQANGSATGPGGAAGIALNQPGATGGPPAGFNPGPAGSGMTVTILARADMAGAGFRRLAEVRVGGRAGFVVLRWETGFTAVANAASEPDAASAQGPG